MAQQTLEVKTTEDHRIKLSELQNYRPNMWPLVLRNDQSSQEPYPSRLWHTRPSNSASQSLVLAAIILYVLPQWGWVGEAMSGSYARLLS